MASTNEGSALQWERVAEELRACREKQRQAWGNLDNATLGRYLAGEASAAEQKAVEAALVNHPELRTLTDLVRDVLGEIESIPADVPEAATLPMPAPVAQPSPEAPVILSLSAPRPRRSVPTSFPRYVSLLAAACLLIALGMMFLRPSRWAPQQRSAELALSQPVAFRTPAGVDLTEAEKALRAAEKEALLAAPLSAEEKRFSEAEPTTPQKARNLAFLYQNALVSVRDEAEKDRESSPSLKLVPSGGHGNGMIVPVRVADSIPPQQFLSKGQPEFQYDSPGHAEKARRAVRTLRERIVNCPAQEVKRSVVPVLTQALRQANTPEERTAYASALGELGPAAQDAVPVLAECICSATSPRERQAYESALLQMGPAARKAWANNPAVAARTHPTLDRTLERLQGVEGRIGVNDEAGCFSIRCLRDGNRHLQHLARSKHLDVLVETVCHREKDCTERCHLEVKELGPRAIHVVIVRDPVSVQVTVSETLRKEGFAVAALQKQLEAIVKAHPCDQALESTIRALTSAKQEAKKRK